MNIVLLNVLLTHSEYHSYLNLDEQNRLADTENDRTT